MTVLVISLAAQRLDITLTIMAVLSFGQHTMRMFIIHYFVTFTARFVQNHSSYQYHQTFRYLISSIKLRLSGLCLLASMYCLHSIKQLFLIEAYKQRHPWNATSLYIARTIINSFFVFQRPITQCSVIINSCYRALTCSFALSELKWTLHLIRYINRLSNIAMIL